jgi:hypothetical protein
VALRQRERACTVGGAAGRDDHDHLVTADHDASGGELGLSMLVEV